MSRVPACAGRTGALLAAFAALAAYGAGDARAQAPAAPREHPTPAERADYLSFTAASEVEPYLAGLANEDGGVTLEWIGGDPAIPVLGIAPRGSADPAPVRVLVIGAQHGDERAGLEVALRLARDLVVGPLARLRAGLELRVVPMANPGGVASRRRETTDGVDLASDHLALRSEEARALRGLLRDWRPHLVLDLHELGPTEYTVQIAVPTHPNVDPSIRELARFYLLPHAANALARADVRFHEYVSPWIDDETAEIAAVPVDDPRAWYSPPATDPSLARNAFSLAGSVTLFVATASSRDILGLGDRVERLHVASAALLEAAAGLGEVLIPAVEAAAARPEDPLSTGHGYEAQSPNATLSWIYINERGQRGPGELAPWRANLVVRSTAELPLGWWFHPIGRGPAFESTLRTHGFATGGDPPERALADRPWPDAIWVEAPSRDARLLFTILEFPELAGMDPAGVRRVPR